MGSRILSPDVQRTLKHCLRKNSYRLPQLPVVRYVCELYLDAYFGNTDANARFNGESAFLRRIIPTNRTDYIVFDVGANVGKWSQEVLEFNSSIKVHCFEPAVGTFRILCKNLPNTVTCENLALGSRAGDNLFFEYENGSVHNSFFNHEGYTTTSKSEVSVDTLDNYCKHERISRIDFLKVDVEGAEFEVLQGASNLLSNEQIGVVQFEYGSKWIDAHTFLKDLYEFLDDFRYAVWKLVPGGKLRPLPYYDYRFEQFRHSTFILTSPSISLS